MKHIKQFLAGILLVSLGLLTNVPETSARLIFTTEEDGTKSSEYHIDQGDSSSSNIDLAFGSSLTNRLRYDVSAGEFSFSKALSLAGNALKNFIIEKLASDPATCDSSAAGRMYYKTGTNEMMFCNGSAWTAFEAGGISDGSITGVKLNAAVAGNGLGKDGSNNLEVKVDDSTIEIDTDALRVKDSGITSAKLGADAVTAAKLNADTAGAGLGQNGGTGALEINVDDTGIEISSDTIQLKDGGVVAGKIGADAVTAAKLNADTAGLGIVQNGGTGALDLNVDDSTVEINSDTIQVKDGGITSAKITDNTIAFADIAEREVTFTLTPEYPNFSLYADGTNNVGTMKADYDNTDDRNYYEWSTKQGSAQDYDIIIQWPIPENFQSWSSSSDEIQLDVKSTTTTAANNKLDITLSDTAGSDVTLTGGTDIASSTADTWRNNYGITFSGGTWTPGGYATMKIKMTATNTNAIQLGEIRFNSRVK